MDITGNAVLLDQEVEQQHILAQAGASVVQAQRLIARGIADSEAIYTEHGRVDSAYILIGEVGIGSRVIEPGYTHQRVEPRVRYSAGDSDDIRIASLEGGEAGTGTR